MYYFENQVSIVRVEDVDEDDNVWALVKDNSVKNKRYYQTNLLCLGHKDDAVFFNSNSTRKVGCDKLIKKSIFVLWQQRTKKI